MAGAGDAMNSAAGFEGGGVEDPHPRSVIERAETTVATVFTGKPSPARS
jgi:hypothetical protein